MCHHLLVKDGLRERSARAWGGNGQAMREADGLSFSWANLPPSPLHSLLSALSALMQTEVGM